MPIFSEKTLNVGPFRILYILAITLKRIPPVILMAAAYE